MVQQQPKKTIDLALQGSSGRPLGECRMIALNAPGTFRRLQGFSSCKQIVSAPAVRDWSGQAMFHRIFVHLHTSGSPFAKYGSWLAPAQPHQDQFCESSIGVLIV